MSKIVAHLSLCKHQYREIVNLLDYIPLKRQSYNGCLGNAKTPMLAAIRKMKITRIAAVLFISGIIACGSPSNRPDQFEKSILDCIYHVHDSMGIDLKSELLAFERNLVDNDQLADSTGLSYVKIIEQIVENNASPIISDYSIESLNARTLLAFGKCFNSKRDDPNIAGSNSNIELIYNAHDSILTSDNVKPSVLSQALLSILEADDFNNEFYKIYALYVLYVASNAQNFDLLPLSDGPIIELSINEDQEIFLNGRLTVLDSLSAQILAITQGYSDEELKMYTTRLTVNKAVKMGIVSDIKQQLRDLNAKQIVYRTK